MYELENQRNYTTPEKKEFDKQLQFAGQKAKEKNQTQSAARTAEA
jgi:hypothetical protein